MWVFSNEKQQNINKSAEDEREELSTTINITTTNNDASIFPEEHLQMK